MDAITKISKDSAYEIIAQKHNPVYPQWVKSIEIVKEFIMKNNLIVYGGTAIDFALRLKGDKLYNDDSLLIADLDFYSPIHAEHAYQLTDILFKEGFDEVRAINASHYSTMRVDIKGNTWVADISYCPSILLDKIPTILFQGMRVVAPEYQYMDMHRLLSTPYDDAPRENIFNRAKKDIERYNMLYKHYPIICEQTKHELYKVAIDTKFVQQGFNAYSVIYHVFSNLVAQSRKDQLQKENHEIIKAHLSFENKKLICQSADPKGIVIHLNPTKLDALSGAKYYEPIASIIPERIETPTTKIFITENELISINEVNVFNNHIRICNIHSVMRWMLSMNYMGIYSFDTKQYYLSLKQMINIIEEKYSGLSDADKHRADIFFPSTNVYGVRNKTPSQQMFANKTDSTIYGDEIIYTSPAHYYPARNREHSVFDYNSSKFFRMSGLEIAHK